MVGSSKILTVSYGTFSCTLEGFDDSFSTMKAIAEYFRDLAADDRYFGAEPPSPDAEMLARIAEREVSRRVEARTDGSNVVLKTGSALAATAAIAAEDTPSNEPVAEAAPTMPPAAEAPAFAMPQNSEPEMLAPSQEFEDDIEEAEAFFEAPASAPAADHPDAESVAAKLQRIRAVVGRGPMGQPTDADAATNDNAESIFADTDAAPIEAEPEADIAVADVDHEDEAASEREAAAEDTVAAPYSPFEAVTADEDAASEDDTADAEEFASVDDAPDVAETDADDDEDAASEADAEAAPAPVRARVIRMRKADLAAPIAATAASAADDAQDGNDLSSLIGRVTGNTSEASEDLTDAAETVEFGISEEVSAEDIADLEQLDGLPSDVEALVEETSLSADAEADLQAELAALTGNLGEEEDQDEEAEIEPLELSNDDLVTDDLSEELNAIEDEFEAPAFEDEFEAPAAEDEVEAPAAEDAAPLRPRRVQMASSIDDDEDAMSRIMSETEAKMSSPDQSRRRESIAQLKAAVAATEADREVSAEQSAESEAESAFRDDLEQAVRPTRPIRPARPTGRAERAERSERPQAAPLKLVASQRIDVPEATAAESTGPITPVRPRRVAAAPAAEAPAQQTSQEQSGGFAEFANSMGAQDLSDLLEAAAAYTSFVEGSEDFSRPQLMNKVKEMSEQEYSREEGLRSFGTLLRQGRIMKVRNGRFQVSDETRFNPERRAG